MMKIPEKGNIAVNNQNCMLCGSRGSFVFVHDLRDTKSRKVYRCKRCGHIQLLPLPTREEDEEFYQRDDMYKTTFANNDEFKTKEAMMYRMREMVFEQTNKFAQYIKIGQKILDIGTGYGWTVELLREKGFAVDGVEISDEKRELCKRRCGIDVFSWNFLNDIPQVREMEGYYDVICLMQTLEHISDPINFISRAGRLLGSNGMIYIDVPNYDDYWKALIPEYDNFSYSRQHLSYFTGKTLVTCMKQAGYTDISICGHQLYSFENALWWQREKRPFLDYHQIQVFEPLEWLNAIYKDRMESELMSNFLVGIGYK